jgi:crossover junction endodeoxyribonuclease RusA
VTVLLTIPGRPVPLQRSRTSAGRHYLPPRSRAYRELIQATWLEAGRPSLGDAPFAASMRFYGARGGSDLSNLVKAIEDALNTLAYVDDRQCVCLSGCHLLPADDRGPRAEIDLWPASEVTL